MQTNDEFLDDVFNFSQYGGLIQVFVLHVIKQGAQIISESDLKDYPENHIIDRDAWKGMANEVLGKFKTSGR